MVRLTERRLALTMGELMVDLLVELMVGLLVVVLLFL